ncbi:MAG TPA: hypothetical protein VIG99_28470 [Myxococcaceae bacterium]|jgi:hypothetical protein
MGQKSWILAGVAVLLAVLRLLYPDAKVDAITVWLLGLAGVLFVLRDLVPYVEQIKLGDTEIKLRQEIGMAASEVAGAQQRMGASPDWQMEPVPADVQKVVEEAAKEPQAALLLLSSQLEELARRRVKPVAPEESRRVYALPRLIEVGISKGVFPETVLQPARQFWDVRNQVLHGGSRGVDRSTVMSVLAIGMDLMKLLSAEPRSAPA